MPTGPAPKRQEERINRNKKAAGEWQDVPNELYTGPKPPKPAGLCDYAEQWWDLVWLNPVANKWTSVDRMEVVRLIMLADTIGRDEGDPDTGAPNRAGWVDTKFSQLLRFLALTPDGLRDRRWELTEQEVADERSEAVVNTDDARWDNLANRFNN